jgi:hypothetical protein
MWTKYVLFLHRKEVFEKAQETMRLAGPAAAAMPAQYHP